MERYFFTNPTNGRIVSVDYPGLHRGFQKWNLATPIVVIDGVVQYGQRLQATQNDEIKCSRQCQLATEPFCVCSCGGKNHGVVWNGAHKSRVWRGDGDDSSDED